MLLLTKILTQLVYPLTVGLGLQLLGLLLLALRWRRTGASAIVTGIAVIWLAATPGAAAWLTLSLESRYPPYPPDEAPTAAAIVVLGGSVSAAVPPRTGAELTEASDRVLYAARLYRAGRAPLVVASGGNLPWHAGAPPEAETVADLLMEWGVPEEAILLEDRSQTTRENAVNSRLLLDERGIDRILLVTSAFHMPRSVATFEAVGLEPIPAPADFVISEEQNTSVLRFFPDAGSLGLSSRALKEYLGIWVYRWRGW